MDRLILLRHGKAEADAPSGKDFDRALTERGRRDTAAIACALAEAGLAPDLVLVSCAARTLQTWEAAAPSFPAARMQPEPALYTIAPVEILALARAEACQARVVMVVGHNPALGQLAAWLAEEEPSPALARARLARGFPTAAAAVIDFHPPRLRVLHAPEPGAESSGSRRLSRVYKILTEAAWTAAVRQGRFDGAAIDLRDGYIHLSAAAQAQDTARLHFWGQAGLVLAGFDAADLGPALTWEASRGGQLFPHLYGPLDPALARAVTPAPLDAEGAPRLDLAAWG